MKLAVNIAIRDRVHIPSSYKMKVSAQLVSLTAVDDWNAFTNLLFVVS